MNEGKGSTPRTNETRSNSDFCERDIDFVSSDFFPISNVLFASKIHLFNANSKYSAQGLLPTPICLDTDITDIMLMNNGIMLMDTAIHIAKCYSHDVKNSFKFS